LLELRCLILLELRCLILLELWRPHPRERRERGSPDANEVSVRPFSSMFFEEWFPQRAEGPRGNPTKKKMVLK